MYTDWDDVTTVYQDSVSTATETPFDYEEATEIQTTTDLTTSLVYETTTVTPTIELSDLPRSTVYAACGADNFASVIAGYGIVGISVEPRERSGVSAPQYPAADSAQSWCEACMSQTDVTCAGSVRLLNLCFFITITDQCKGSEAFISFDVSRDREFSPDASWLLSNSACGQQVWSGRYCDQFSGNCDVVPAPTA